MKIKDSTPQILAALRRLSMSGFEDRRAMYVAKELQKPEYGLQLSVNTLRLHEAVLQFCKTDIISYEPEPDEPGSKVETEETDKYLRASGNGFETVEAFIKRAGIDLNVWRITKVIRGEHLMGYKDNAGKAHTVPLYNFKVEAAPIDKKAFDYMKARDFVISEMKEHAPQYKPIKRTGPVGEHLLVIDPADVHFGKLAVATETGESYNMAIARERILAGVSGLINAAKGYEIGRVLLLVGNDILHVDNSIATTTNGTFQNTDGLWFEMFQNAKKALVEVIEMLLTVADVDVIFNPSNHDFVSGYMLTDSLSSWFHTCPNVQFNGDPSHRKYYQYGNSLIGSTHGDGAKPQDLPGLMAQEVPDLWAATKYRYFYTHHIHHKDRVRFQETKDFIGVTVEPVRSPSASDSWHAKKGYKGVPKAVEGFIHSATKGQVARLTYPF